MDAHGHGYAWGRDKQFAPPNHLSSARQTSANHQRAVTYAGVSAFHFDRVAGPPSPSAPQKRCRNLPLLVTGEILPFYPLPFLFLFSSVFWIDLDQSVTQELVVARTHQPNALVNKFLGLPSAVSLVENPIGPLELNER